MSHRQFVLSSLCAAACTAFAAEPAPPATLDPVTVEAPVQTSVQAFARVDVRAACPGVDAQLQQTLSSAWGRVGKAGTMQVRFRLEGDRVTGVYATGVSQDYQPYVRKAIRRLTCTTASAQPQDYRFLIVMRDPDEAIAGEAQVALVSPLVTEK